MVIPRALLPVFCRCWILSFPLSAVRSRWFSRSFLFSVSCSWFFRGQFVCQASLQPSPLFSNSFVLPPIILIPQVSRFVKSQSFPCTIGVHDIRPQKFWWPLLQSYSSFQLAPRGTLGMILPISSEGFSLRWPLPWDFWVFRIGPL